jgi:TolB-like protein/tetratricopeptide (TPR) repeat protein
MVSPASESSPACASGAVFLSYAREDTVAASHLADALRGAGIEVWFDRSELTGGDAWDAKIRNQIKTCALFVPVLSAATQARREGYFRIEWKLAAQRTHAIADGTPFLVPVVIDGTAEADALVPEEFRAVQWTRVTGDAAGDKFCARVRKLLNGAPVPSHVSASPVNVARPSNSSRRGLRVATWIGVLCAIALLAGAIGWFSRQPTSPKTTVKTLAVLPFVTSRGDNDEDNISDGIADEVLTQLGRAPGLRVSGRMSSFSFKGQKLTDAEIARKLDVEYLVTGTFQKDGSRVRVRPSLVNAANGSILWGETFTKELTNVFALQDEIAGLIAQKLEVRLGGAARTTRTVNPVAYGLAQKGRYLWLKRTDDELAEAQGAYEEAIKIDPGYAEAHSGLADVCLVRGWYLSLEGVNQGQPFFNRAREAAGQAVRLDPTLAEPHAALGALDFNEERLEESEQQFLAALRLNPNYSYAHHWHAHLLGMRGRIDEAVAEMERATQIDPFSLSTLVIHATFLAHAGRHAEAVAIDDRALAVQSTFLPAHGVRCLSLLMIGRKDEALAEARFVTKDSSAKPRWWMDANAIYVLRKMGHDDEARSHAKRLLATAPESSYFHMYAAAAMGQVDQALDALRRTPVTSTAQAMVYFSEPWAEIRRSPRFPEVMKAIGWWERYETARTTVERMSKEAVASRTRTP